MKDGVPKWIHFRKNWIQHAKTKKSKYMCIFDLSFFINLYNPLINRKFCLLSWQQNSSIILFLDFVLVTNCCALN